MVTIKSLHLGEDHPTHPNLKPSDLGIIFMWVGGGTAQERGKQYKSQVMPTKVCLVQYYMLAKCFIFLNQVYFTILYVWFQTCRTNWFFSESIFKSNSDEIMINFKSFAVS